LRPEHRERPRSGAPLRLETSVRIIRPTIRRVPIMPAFLPLSRIMRLLLGASSLFWPGFAASVFAAH
jgi:hypothetical protein